ncbi:ATP-binding protein [Citricoccus muralis]|uniref:ATP-binding protein n=1 Tax=Citricoccus muralis TaxID=169134 RepID=A0ABY8H9W0_9MICC|nr:ATP-binding protein [Citricoccus muralis]WFP17639.1 ATP-binding protein [Citricoccus muralis]
MESASHDAPFTFSWLALKLLGRGLYSNPWSALSELVANGLDAGAQNVYVYVDARDKSKATIEVVDDGTGMSRADILNYVKVGFNKREHAMATGASNAGEVKGRKGIGKLAALFLSRHFYLQTKHKDDGSNWELDARDGKVSDEENPSLKATDDVPWTANEELWNQTATGTRLVMLDVDLTGYGPQSINALGSRLANQFLLPDNASPRILLSVRSSETETNYNYSPVKKNVAFGNLAEIAQYFTSNDVQPDELVGDPTVLNVPAKELPGGNYEHIQSRTTFPLDPPEDESWEEIAKFVDRSNQTYQGVKYSLTGWIGVHATIDNKGAKANDNRFIKNKYYNPAQLRVYVRGKLASDRLLSQLGITGTYANYIEGEISFDLLDDDSLPDIATSNRQDFDETDGRVTLLRALVRPIVGNLIQRRTALAKQISAAGKAEKERRDTSAKHQFSDQLRRDLDHHSDISKGIRDELHMTITGKVQGNVPVKQNFRVFISHARADKAFARFIDDLLRSRGVRAEEVFFTSRAGAVDLALDERALSTVIKENITDANTLIFYMTSRHFLDSQFCLFEGGAGWATRAVSEYLKLNMDFNSIPKFLTDGRSEQSVIGPDDNIELRPELHNYLVKGVLNPMIEHLNRGREIAGGVLIEPFELRTAPSAVEMSREGKTAKDYFDQSIVEHWDVLISTEIKTYLTEYLKQ